MRIFFVLLFIFTLATFQAFQLEASGDGHGEKPDPVAANGPIFKGWPRPQLVFLFSGEMDGYLEPCGCAGLDNQKGGLKRRHTLLQQLEAKGWPVVALDLGGEVRRLGPQAEIKYRYSLKSLLGMGYDSVALGSRELLLDANYLAVALSDFMEGGSPIVSANVAIIDAEIGLTSRYRVVKKGGKRIGVTSVLGRKHRVALQNASDIHWTAPEKALAEVVAQLEAERCDMLVLLVHADPQEATQLAQQFPQFQLVATTGGAPEQPLRMVKIEGSKVPLVEVGHKGMYVSVIGMFDDPKKPLRYQRVPMDHRFEDSQAMQALLVAYQQELEGLGLEGLGITGVRHTEGKFIGSEACADCHAEATEVFLATPHAHATDTLAQLDPPRHFDPECLSCHATGWNPRKFFPYRSGYLGLTKTPALAGNGCENCHGPGAAHVAAESGDKEVDDAELERLRASLRMKIIENEGNQKGQVYENGVVVQKCMECHDEDNSPDFDFQKYWPKVEHYGKE